MCLCFILGVIPRWPVCPPFMCLRSIQPLLALSPPQCCDNVSQSSNKMRLNVCSCSFSETNPEESSKPQMLRIMGKEEQVQSLLFGRARQKHEISADAILFSLFRLVFVTETENLMIQCYRSDVTSALTVNLCESTSVVFEEDPWRLALLLEIWRMFPIKMYVRNRKAFQILPD